MINFSVGPVQMDNETLLIGKEQIPYFRTTEFSNLMFQNEKILCKLFDSPDESRVIFLTGSGTASMEAGIMNFFDSNDKVLVVNGGSFGQRLVELCQIHEVNYTEIKVQSGHGLLTEQLEIFNNKGYTGFLVQLCETSTGVLYDMDLIGNFCKRNNIFLFVDAISGFLADEISMKKMNINAVITGSQKALSLPPSMSFTVLDKIAIEKCKKINVRNLYFNFPEYLKNGDRGQTPFTPAVGTLIQLNEKLIRIEKNGGIKSENYIARERAKYFRNKIKDLPFKLYSNEKDLSNCVTALSPLNENINAYSIFEILKDEYNIWICPNGGELTTKVFRVGHLGAISNKEIDKLIDAFNDLIKRNII